MSVDRSILLKRFGFAILAVLFALAAGVLARRILQEKILEIEQKSAVHRIAVLVAKSKISSEAIIQEKDLETRMIPEEWLPSYAALASASEQILGRISGYDFLPGDILITHIPQAKLEPSPCSQPQIKNSPLIENHPKSVAKQKRQPIVLYGNQPF